MILTIIADCSCYELYSLIYTVFVYCAYDILFLAHLVYFLESDVCFAHSSGWHGIAVVTAGVLSGRVGGVDVARFCV